MCLFFPYLALNETPTTQLQIDEIIFGLLLKLKSDKNLFGLLIIYITHLA